MWSIYETVSALPFAQKAVTAAVALAVVVLVLGGTIHEAQAVLQTTAAISVVIAAARGEP
jgi:hypothetical protein